MPVGVYEQQIANAERRRQIAEELQARQFASQHQLGAGRMNVSQGGMTVPISLAEALAPIGQALMTRRARKKADEAEDEARKTRGSDIVAALEQYRGAVPDQDVGLASIGSVMNAPDDRLMDPIYGQTEARDNLADTVLGPEQSAAMLLAQAMTPEESYTLGKDQVRMQGSREVARGPMTPPPGPNLPSGMRMGANGPEWIPSYLEGQKDLRAAGAARTNIDMGTLPTGFQYVRDEQGRVLRMEPIPGSPAAMEADADAQASATKAANAAAGTQVLTQDIDRALEKIGPFTTGWGAYLSSIPGTEARNLAGLLDTIRAKVGFEQLQKMRDASPTGGALGQVSEMENRLLQSVLGNLEQSQNDQQLRDNLNRVWNITQDIVHGPGNGPERRPLSFEQGLGMQAPPAAQAQAQAPAQAVEYLRAHPELADQFKAKYGYLPEGM